MLATSVHTSSVKSCTGVILTALLHQMLLPPIHPRVDVQVAEGTPIGSCHRLRRQALLFLNVGFVWLLVNSLFAARTLLIIFAVGTFTNKVRGEVAYFDGLAALAADDEHGAGVEVMHILIVFLGESLVHSLAKLANMVLVDLIGRLHCLLLGSLDELVAPLQLLLPALCRPFLGHFRFYWLLIVALRLLHVPCFFQFLLNRFDDGRP